MPWMTTLVVLSTGVVLRVVGSRDSKAVGPATADPAACPRGGTASRLSRSTGSAAFRKKRREQLPEAAVSADKFHLLEFGGHFPAMEASEELVGDIRAFFATIR